MCGTGDYIWKQMLGGREVPPEVYEARAMLVFAEGEEGVLGHVREVLSGVVGDRYVFYTGAIVEGDAWDGELFQKRLLAGGGMEERAEAAFEVVFGEGHEKAVLVRAGAVGLRPSDLNGVFRELALKDRVVGEWVEGRRSSQ